MERGPPRSPALLRLRGRPNDAQENRCDALTLAPKMAPAAGISGPLPGAGGSCPGWNRGAGAACPGSQAGRDSSCPASPLGREAGGGRAHRSLLGATSSIRARAARECGPRACNSAGNGDRGACAAFGPATRSGTSHSGPIGGFTSVRIIHGSAQDPVPNLRAKRHGVAGNPGGAGVEFLYRRQKGKTEHRFPRRGDR